MPLGLQNSLRLLAERMPGLTRAGAVRRRNSSTIRGPLRLPVSAGKDRRGATTTIAV